MALLPVADALARILDAVVPSEAETVPILDAHGRVLASDLAARLTQPPFAASAMDGYTVRAEDVAAAPARLAVIGTSAAGHAFSGSLGPGKAVRIFTGAPLPEGSDTVVIQENTAADGTEIVIRETAKRGANVRERGIDFAAGQALLSAGRTLDAHALTLAAAAGWAEIPVRRKPVVAILATGDELVAPGTIPGPDQIVSANPIGIAALVAAAGGVPRVLGIASDTEKAITEKLSGLADTDVLVTIGGASVGDHDLVAPALGALGMKLEFWKVAIRPGKPLIFGRLGKTRVLGLPGNPVSALICGHVFLRPLIRALLGSSESTAPREIARLTHALEENGPRLHLMRAKLSVAPDGKLAVTAQPSQDSSLLSALASADCLIVREPNAQGLAANADVEIERLSF